MTKGRGKILECICFTFLDTDAGGNDASQSPFFCYKCTPKVEEPAPVDEFYAMLQRAQGRNPGLLLPVTPVPPTPGFLSVPPTPAVAGAAGGIHVDEDEDLSLAELFDLQGAAPALPKHRVMLYKASKIRPRAVVAIRQLLSPKSQVGQASVLDGLEVGRAQEIAQQFVHFLAVGAIDEGDVSELLADSFRWVVGNQ